MNTLNSLLNRLPFFAALSRQDAKVARLDEQGASKQRIAR